MKCRYFCRLPLDISPVYLTRGISIFLKTIYGSGSDCIQLAMGTLEFASERELEQSSVIFTDRLEIKEVCLFKEIQKDLWIIASGNPDIEKNKLV